MVVTGSMTRCPQKPSLAQSICPNDIGLANYLIEILRHSSNRSPPVFANGASRNNHSKIRRRHIQVLQNDRDTALASLREDRTKHVGFGYPRHTLPYAIVFSPIVEY